MIEISRLLNIYFKTIFIEIALISIGLLLNKYVNPDIFNLPGFPYNIYILAGSIFLIVLVYYHLKKTSFIKWFIQPPVFIIALFFTLIYYSIFYLFQNNIIQLSSPLLLLLFKTNSWVAGLLNIFMLLSASFTVLFYLIPIRVKYFGLIFFRLGLAFFLIAYWFGKSDRIKVTINLIEKGQENSFGIEPSGEIIELPFAIKLIDFELVNTSYSVFSVHHWKYLYFSHVKKQPNMQSKIIIYNDSIVSDTITLSLYQPINIKGWFLSQKGFDESRGILSSLSIIEAKKVPWKIVSKIALYSIAFGTILILLNRKPKNKRIKYPTTYYK